MKVSFRRLAYDVFFRFSPILIVILLELALRFLGIGESYLLFNKSEDGLYYQLNPIYYRRFISAKQFPDVNILPQKIPIDKPENSYRIFIIGDQTLCSSFSDANEKPLIEDYTDEDGTYYDFVQLAVPFTNSFAVKRLLKNSVKYEADACVVVTGGNEYYGIPRKSDWLQDIENYWGLNFYVSMKNHRFIQVLERFVYIKKENQNVFPPENIDDWIIPYDSQVFWEPVNYFQRNLFKISQKSECPIFLVSMPVNIVATPYRSLFVDKELKDEDFARECAVLVDNADRFTIERWINDLEAWEPGTSIYYYCRAVIAEKEGKYEEALNNYNMALETDAFRVRINQEIYNIMLEISREQNIELIDLLNHMNTISDNGLDIDKYFIDGIHLNQRGKEIVLNRIRASLESFFNP